LVLTADKEPHDWRNTVITNAIYKGRDTPRNRYLIAIKATLVHLYLIRILSERRRRLHELNPNDQQYWPWPFLDKSEKPKPLDPQNAARKKKKHVRPQRPSQGSP
jgi:hypothetical protein